MIQLRTSQKIPLVVEMNMTSPSVYLDYCVIGDFADNPKLGKRFLDALSETNGTVCLSLMHLIEVFGLGVGPTYSQITSFLNSIEDKFVIFDFIPDRVIEREKSWKVGDPLPFLEVGLMNQIIDRWDKSAKINFSLLLKGLEKYPQLVPDWKKVHVQTKKALKELVNNARKNYRNDSSVRMNLAKNGCPDPKISGTTEYVNCILVKECIKTHEEFNDSDGLDFFHSVVAFSYSDFIVLDKKWARRLRKISVPTKSAKVFATNEYDSFITAFRS